MKIDNVKRIKIDEFPRELRPSIERIANIYNFFSEQVTNAINGQIDIDNLDRDIISIELSVDSGGLPVIQTRFSNTIGLQGTKVIRADNLTNPAIYPSQSPFISFTSSGSGIYTIKHISGLQANNNYRLIIELIY